MSSKLQTTDLKDIDQVVMCEFEKVSGLATDWGTVIDEDLKIGRPEKVLIVEACFLQLLPEYEWTAPDMTLLQSLETVEEWIEVFEGICDTQDAPEEPMYTFNFP